jgi:hypothetical protein
MSPKEFDVHLDAHVSNVHIEQNKAFLNQLAIEATGGHIESSPEDHPDEEVDGLKAAFDKIACQELATPYEYSSVAVLIVRWADYLDRDLNCRPEVIQPTNRLLLEY